MSEEYTPVGSTVAFTVPTYVEAADGPKLAKDIADDVSANYVTKTAAETISNKTLGSNLAAGGFKVTGLADPSSAQDAATKAYTDSLVLLNVPVGTILPFAGSTAPTGWVLCRGQAIPRGGVNQPLFDLIGTTYGSGNGTTTFQVPNLGGRVPVGVDAGQTEFSVVAATGGNKATQTHTHTIEGAGAHGHSFASDGTHGHGFTNDGAHSHGGATGTHGGYSYISNVDTTSTAQGGGQQPGIRSFSNLVVGHSHTISSDGSHGHSFAAAANHGHSFVAATDHQHPATSFGTGAGSTSVAGNLQPFLAINFIIKAVA